MVKTKYARQDDIPEAHRELFVERDGAWIANLEPVDGWAVEDVAGLRSTAESERHQRREAEKALKARGDATPETISELQARIEELQNAKPDEKLEAQWQEKERKLLEAHEAERTKLTTENGTLQSRLQRGDMVREATELIQKYGGNVRTLLPHVLSQLTPEQVGEGLEATYRGVVVDAEGKERITMRSGQTGRMPLDELVESMSKDDDFAPLFSPRGERGSGLNAGGDEGGGGGQNGFQISREDAQDPAKWRAMRERAAKAGQVVEIMDDN